MGKSNMPWVQPMFKVKVTGSFTKNDNITLRIVTFEKGPEDKYVYHNWLANIQPFELRDSARKLVEGDYINILQAKMKTWYSKKTGKGGVIMDILDFVEYNKDNADINPFEEKDKEEKELSEDDLPF